MGDGTVDRRRFIGLGLAAAGGAAVVGPGDWASRARLRWESTAGFPGRPNALVLEAPDLPDGVEVMVDVTVDGPQGALSLDRRSVRVEGGRARVDMALTYPYERRVAGVYTYRGVVQWRGGALRTDAPASYAVRRWRPLS